MAETKFLDSAGLTHLLEKTNAKFSKVGHTHTKADITDFAHTHDDRYYQKSEVDSKLNGKSNTGHTHDDRYYTESEMNTKLASKSDTSHSHTTHLTTEIAASTNLNTLTTAGWYKCSASATAAGLTNCPTKNAFAMEVLSNAGVTQTVYEFVTSGQKIYTRNTYDGTWGAWQRIYTEANKPTPGELGAAASSHTHTKSQITDFPTSMPASDVYAWAKAATKPTYTKAEVGLGNVDNTADSAKSVKYATSAGSAGTATTANNVSGQAASSDSARHVWFSHAGTETSRVYNDNFKYNPASNTLTTNITGNAASASSVAWGNVSGKPSTFAPSAHTHTKSQITDFPASLKNPSALTISLNGTSQGAYDGSAAKSINVTPSSIGAAAASHSHSYLPLSGGTLTGKATRGAGGSWIQARNNVAVDGTAAGKYSYNVVVGQKTPNGHWSIGNLGSNEQLCFSYDTDTNYNAGTNQSNVVYLPTNGGTIITSASIGSQSVNYANTAGSAKASDVSAWAKASTKPSYTKAEVGLGNVDNTADSTKSVKYATSAGSASSATSATQLTTARKLKVNLAAADAQSFNGTADAQSIGVSGKLAISNGGTGADSINGIRDNIGVNQVTTGGTGAAYTASVNGITSLIAGKSFIMVPNVTSTTVAPTLNVNGLGAKNIRLRLSSNTSSTIQLIKSDFLVANKPVKVVYDGTYWVLDDFAQPDANYLYGTLISRGTSAPSDSTGGYIYIQTT